MANEPELSDLLVEFIIDYLDGLASSQTLQGQNLRLTSNELRVMTKVTQRFRNNEPCNLTYLVETTGISRATVSRILTTLFEYGLIREEPDSEDRRVRQLYLSEAGKTSMDLVARWLELWAERFEQSVTVGKR